MKVLITADIHIDDYANYNYTDRARLNQYLLLADRLVELGEQYKCTEIWILGDLINKPTSRAYVLHVARQFLKKLSSNFQTIRYILGNHDLDSKSQSLDKINSQVTLFDIPNMEYMNKDIMELDSHSFAWMNWYPDQDLTFLGTDHVDVLLGHYTKSDLFGQEIDEDRFNLMIHGDIHTNQEIGKFISVGNPIPLDFNSLCDNANVLIFDTATLEWERILTDPDHTRFLQMHYTNDKAEEGFHGPLEYKVYYPEIKLDNDEVKEKTITWNNIDSLIRALCEQFNVLDIHSEVESKCIPYSEIDFNFQLKKFHIHGYRSLVDINLDFNKGDRIVLLGDNGSGKSSIIGALKGVFDKNSYLKYEQSELCEDQLLELSLVYQNKLYEITKGNVCKLVIDGEEQQYSKKTDFENDLKIKLPFLNYLDLLFITSDVQNLSNRFTSNRRIELISKFYRLDRINAYWKTALQLYQEVENELDQLRKSRDIEIGVQTHIQTRLSELEEISSVDIKELELKQIEYSDLKDKYQKYQLWIRDRDKYIDQLNSVNNRITKLESESNYDLENAKQSMTNLNDQLIELNDSYEILYKKAIEFESKLKDLIDTESKGKDLANKLESLNQGICPTCGTSLSKSKNKELIEELTVDINKLRDHWNELDYYMGSQPDGRDSKVIYTKSLARLKDQYKEISDAIQILQNRMNLANLSKGKLEAELSHRQELENQYKLHIDNAVDKVELPQGLSDLESKLNSDINKYYEYKKELEDKNKQSKKIEELDKAIQEISERLEKYNTYISLTSMEGKVYQEILSVLAEKFSSTDIKYEVDSGVYRGSNYINFDSSYLVKGTYRYYDRLSTGQRTLCDIDFLDKLFSTQVGLLILDESLAHLDDKNSPRIYEIMKNMNVNTLIVASHDSNISMYNRRFLLHLDETGKTVISYD